MKPPQELSGEELFLCLPEDVLSLISTHLSPRDLISLSLASRSLHTSVNFSDKPWISQCLRLPSPPSLSVLSNWKSNLSSSLSLCRFLYSVLPLLGLWVHQNPELGNLVVVIWGEGNSIPSVIGIRIIPQEIREGCDLGLFYSLVFEILSDFNGRPLYFFLHGRSIYNVSNNSNVVNCSCFESSVSIGFVDGVVHQCCNVLLLEVGVDARKVGCCCSPEFSKLGFSDRRRILELVAEKNRVKLPEHLVSAPLFDTESGSCAKVSEQRGDALVRLHELHGGRVDRKKLESLLASKANSKNNVDVNSRCCVSIKRRSLSSVAEYFKDRLQVMRRSKSMISSSSRARHDKAFAHNERKHVHLNEFLKAGETVSLSLRAVRMKLSMYQAWPNMPDNRFALYKLHVKEPTSGREYAGIWGGTFGWPQGQESEAKPGKALFLVLISYKHVDGNMLLIGTKILEGSHYVLHPNGSAMFTAKLNEPATDPFPWECDGNELPVEVKHSYNGEGIASGYGFRYPGSKPGTLFVMKNGLVAFVWKDTKAVLTLQRLDLQEALKKGERVPALPPVPNFAYLTKSYSNVFAVFSMNMDSRSSKA